MVNLRQHAVSAGAQRLGQRGAKPLSTVPALSIHHRDRRHDVRRWAYMPGSTLSFVWTQSRSTADDDGSFRFGPSMRGMLRAPAENIFMIKATYWWNP